MIDDDDEMDVEKLKEVLSVVATEIPKIIEAVSKQLYSTENAEKMGKTVAQFYKQLKDAGMKDEDAAKLTQAFMENFSMNKMISDFFGKLPRDHDDIDEVVNERIKEKIMKKVDEATDD